jgi:hypothetical protein
MNQPTQAALTQSAKQLLVEALSGLEMTDREIASKIGMSFENLSRFKNQPNRTIRFDNFLLLLWLLPIKKPSSPKLHKTH